MLIVLWRGKALLDPSTSKRIEEEEEKRTMKAVMHHCVIHGEEPGRSHFCCAETPHFKPKMKSKSPGLPSGVNGSKEAPFSFSKGCGGDGPLPPAESRLALDELLSLARPPLPPTLEPFARDQWPSHGEGTQGSRPGRGERSRERIMHNHPLRPGVRLDILARDDISWCDFVPGISVALLAESGTSIGGGRSEPSCLKCFFASIGRGFKEMFAQCEKFLTVGESAWHWPLRKNS